MYLQSQKHSFSHECWEIAEWTVTPKGILHVAHVSFKYANWRVDLPVRQCLFMSDVQFKIYIYHIRNEAHCLSWRSLQSRNFSSLSKVSLNGLKSIFSNSSTSLRKHNHIRKAHFSLQLMWAKNKTTFNIKCNKRLTC